jgi:hypothetical protein
MIKGVAFRAAAPAADFRFAVFPFPFARPPLDEPPLPCYPTPAKEHIMKRSFPLSARAALLVLLALAGGCKNEWMEDIVRPLYDDKKPPDSAPAPVLTLYAAGREGNGVYDAKIWKLAADGTAANTFHLAANAGVFALALHEGSLYAAGYAHDGTQEVATVWELSGNTHTAFPPLTGGPGSAGALAVYGGSLYAAGFEHIGPIDVATVWKLASGTWTPTPLTGGGPGKAYALAVYGDDLYAAGYGGSLREATVWDVMSNAPVFQTGTMAAANAFAVYGGDLYAAGYDYNGSKEVATVWKLTSGTWAKFTALTNGMNSAEAYALAVYGDSLYAAGVEKNSSGKGVAKIWKLNGSTATEFAVLSDGTSDAFPEAILPVWE